MSSYLKHTITTPLTLSSINKQQEKIVENDGFVGEKHFFATGSYVNNDPDVFGQVIEEPHTNLRYGFI